MNYPIPECEKCDRFNHEEMRQRNKLHCSFACEPFKQKALLTAFAYNKAVSGDPNIYGIDGTVLTPNGVKKRGKCDD